MIKIKKHIEENLESATRLYDDTFYKWSNATQAFRQLQAEVETLSITMAKAKQEMEYFQNLLNELNTNIKK